MRAREWTGTGSGRKEETLAGLETETMSTMQQYLVLVVSICEYMCVYMHVLVRSLTLVVRC